MVHQLQLVKVLLAIDQFAQRALEIVTFLVLADLFLFLNNGMSFLQLLPLIFDFLFVLLIFIKDHSLLLLHYFLLLFNNFLHSSLNFLLELLDLVNF